MASRARRAWSTIRGEIRTLLRETTSADSFWTDADLLVWANQTLDLRAMELMEAHEGYCTQAFEDDTVANQREYALPEGTTRVRRVCLVYSDGEEIELSRNDRIGQDYYPSNNSGTGRYGVRPTYRLVDNLLYIEPPDPESRTDGLRIEIECLPSRLTADDSKLSLAYPDTMETLLTYDVWDVAMGVEDAQGNVNEEVRGRLQRFHMKLEKAWRSIIEVRNQSRVFGQPMFLGD